MDRPDAQRDNPDRAGDVVAAPEEQLFKTNIAGWDQRWLETKMMPQTRVFYNDLLPVFFQVCRMLWRREVLNVADIGTNSGVGAAHLHDVVNNLTIYRVRITGFDSDHRYQAYAEAKFPQIEFVSGDFFTDPRSFDIVLCSHTLEHIPNPGAFVDRVLGKASVAIFYTPYEEQKLIPGHINRIDDELLRSLPGIIWASVKRSVGWRADGENSRCVAFVCLSPARRNDAAWIDELRSRLDDEFSSRPLSVT